MSEQTVDEYPECRGCLDEYRRVRMLNDILFAGILVAAVLFFSLGLITGGEIYGNHAETNYEQGRTQ